MNQRQSMPHWWRYWSFGLGVLILLAAGALYVLFDPSTALAYFDIFLLVAAALLIFLSGSEIQFTIGTRRIRAKHFVAASQLLIGVLLLLSPIIAFLEQAIEPYDVIDVASGLFMLLLGLGTLYRPATFGPYHSADQPPE
jgi:peptidoglycan/LPS O-acetylase OafA/YrhL